MAGSIPIQLDIPTVFQVPIGAPKLAGYSECISMRAPPRVPQLYRALVQKVVCLLPSGIVEPNVPLTPRLLSIGGGCVRFFLEFQIVEPNFPLRDSQIRSLTNSNIIRPDQKNISL